MNTSESQIYTVAQLSKLSGVSVRTLHFYDEIDLLKPAYYGDNGYRYYKKEQLLNLQQILFYRELKFELSAIKDILFDPYFDQVKALKAHRQRLQSDMHRTENLIQTIDKTIAHIEKRDAMDENEMYFGFSREKQTEYENEIVERWGESALANIESSKLKMKNWTKQDFANIQNEYDRIHRKMTELLIRKEPVDSPQVQELIRDHYAVVAKFWKPNSEAYKNLGLMYLEHPDFRKLYDRYHPELASYLAAAMALWAQKLE